MISGLFDTQKFLENILVKIEGKCFLQARECIYLMRSSNFRNNQMILEVYVMAIEACIEMDNVDEGFLFEEMTRAFESSVLYVRKLYYDILRFSRTSRYEIHTNQAISNLLAEAKKSENSVIETDIYQINSLNRKKRNYGY
jgi:hypothetical protein